MLQNTEALLAQEDEQPTLASKIFNRKTLKMFIGAAAMAGCVAAVYRSYTLDATVGQMDANGDGKVTAYEFGQCWFGCQNNDASNCNNCGNGNTQSNSANLQWGGR